MLQEFLNQGDVIIGIHIDSRGKIFPAGMTAITPYWQLHFLKDKVQMTLYLSL